MPGTDDIRERLEAIAEELADLAMERLQEAVASGSADLAEERRLQRARRSVEKAAHLLEHSEEAEET